jgi:hypothetical protein
MPFSNFRGSNTPQVRPDFSGQSVAQLPLQGQPTKPNYSQSFNPQMVEPMVTNMTPEQKQQLGFLTAEALRKMYGI